MQFDHALLALERFETVAEEGTGLADALFGQAWAAVRKATKRQVAEEALEKLRDTISASPDLTEDDRLKLLTAYAAAAGKLAEARWPAPKPTSTTRGSAPESLRSRLSGSAAQLDNQPNGAQAAVAGRLHDAKDGGRRLEVMRWGLIPYWTKDIKIGFSTINARAEEVDTKPAFREAFQRRRCLVPLDSFYEWKKTAAGKQPYAIAFKDRRLMGMAGLWETWRSPAGERIRSFTIITTQPNELCVELHNRMPAVLEPDVWQAWLGEQAATVHDLKAMLAPYPSDEMICWAVSARVGNVRNNDSGLIEPVAAA